MRLLTLFLGAALVFGSLHSSMAQTWPQRPIRLVVPYPAGGNVDIAARLVGQKLQESLAQPVVVENRAGAGGLVAADAVAKAEPDGYTILAAAHGPMLFSPVINGRSGYNWRNSFVAVGPVNLTPLVMIVNPSLPAKTVSEFLALTKQRRILMGTGGAGSSSHLAGELLQRESGARWETIHYRGNAPTMTALLRGEVNLAFEQTASSIAFLNDGQLRPLAVTSRERLAVLPDVATLIEQSKFGFESATFVGLFVPAKTPHEPVQILSEVLAKAVADQTVVSRFAAIGSQPFVATPEEFSAYLDRENARWIPVINAANIKNE
jgi:tripartite-type tricarboxylate transporter receptor subunit TctC